MDLQASLKCGLPPATESQDLKGFPPLDSLETEVEKITTRDQSPLSPRDERGLPHWLHQALRSHIIGAHVMNKLGAEREKLRHHGRLLQYLKEEMMDADLPVGKYTANAVGMVRTQSSRLISPRSSAF